MNSHNGSLSKLFWAEFGEFIIISVSSLKTCILDVPAMFLGSNYNINCIID